LLPLFCSNQFRRLDSIQFQAHIPAGCLFEARTFASESTALLLLILLIKQVKVKFKLRLTASQSVSLGVEPHLELMASYYCLTVTVLFLWGALSDERTGLLFVHAAGPCQRSLSRVRVPWDLRPYFTVSDLRISFSSLLIKIKVKVTLRLTVSQSVNLGVEPHLGLMTRYLVLFDSYGLVSFCGAPSLTRGRACLLSESLPVLISHLL
jgi:hypothetical protein